MKSPAEHRSNKLLSRSSINLGNRCCAIKWEMRPKLGKKTSQNEKWTTLFLGECRFACCLSTANTTQQAEKQRSKEQREKNEQGCAHNVEWIWSVHRKKNSRTTEKNYPKMYKRYGELERINVLLILNIGNRNGNGKMSQQIAGRIIFHGPFFYLPLSRVALLAWHTILSARQHKLKKRKRKKQCVGKKQGQSFESITIPSANTLNIAKANAISLIFLVLFFSLLLLANVQ